MDKMELDEIRRIVREEIARQDRRGERSGSGRGEEDDSAQADLIRALRSTPSGKLKETPPPEDAVISSEILRSGDDSVGKKAKEYYEQSAPISPPCRMEADSPVSLRGNKDALVASFPTVKVVNAHGKPVACVTVRFSIVSGVSMIANQLPKTDKNGKASAGAWILKSSGCHLLEATIEHPPAYPDRNVKVVFEAIAGE